MSNLCVVLRTVPGGVCHCTLIHHVRTCRVWHWAVLYLAYSHRHVCCCHGNPGSGAWSVVLSDNNGNHPPGAGHSLPTLLGQLREGQQGKLFTIHESALTSYLFGVMSLPFFLYLSFHLSIISFLLSLLLPSILPSFPPLSPPSFPPFLRRSLPPSSLPLYSLSLSIMSFSLL